MVVLTKCRFQLIPLNAEELDISLVRFLILCFPLQDNKTMVTTALPARQNPQQHVLHIADRGNKNHSTTASTKRCRSRIRIPLFVNIAITVIGEYT